MATLALSAAGAALGGAILPGGISVLGTTLTGAAIGSQIGALAGSYVDNALFGASGQTQPVEGPRLSDLQVLTSSEGAPIPRLYGAMRMAGQVIWATELEEEVIRGRQAGGSAKGMGGGSSGGARDTVEYRYFANVAIGLCEGEITRIGRIWADGTEVDPSDFSFRVYTGTNDQQADPLIAAKQGALQTPAFRGLAYVVFERLPLANFGNRVPQLNIEVIRAVDDLEQSIQAAVIIPGAGEFAYDTRTITRDAGAGITRAENVHTRQGGTDWQVSIDQIQQTLPRLQNASLVVSWFGDSLDAGACRIEPRVEIAEKQTSPESWRVAGLTRSLARSVSLVDGRPAYGGTPSDASVIRAIRDLHERGLQVTFNPFILMDMPGYPWRGRIACPPETDQTPAAADAVARFIGTATADDFSTLDNTVVYNGPPEWSLRRMLFHYAHLCLLAGGVDTFLLGSELRGLTTIRSSADDYPTVDALRQIAQELRQLLGAQTKLTYAADWSEYFGHQPDDGTGTVHFHLDPLWAAPEIDAVAIDIYWPLADWRDGLDHADAARAASPHDLTYLRANTRAGEGYDWYYASPADRENQIRTPITDGAANKPWVYRFKDIRSWWGNQHFDRIAGIEKTTPTAWQPESKPIWFTEIGCPAIDKGANQPNVFVDPKSDENALPYFSSATRDDLIQRRVIQAMTTAFDTTKPGVDPDDNPASMHTGEPMVDLSRIYVYAWDARPYPAFPNAEQVWGDAPNWRFGHWINGRIASAPLAQTITTMANDFDLADEIDADGLIGSIGGYMIDRPMSPRQALQPLELAFFFDTVETADTIRCRDRRAARPARHIAREAVVETAASDPLITVTRKQETDLPRAARLTYLASGASYDQSVAAAQSTATDSRTIAEASLPIVLDHDHAEQAAHSWFHESWASRTSLSVALPPSTLALEPGDLITIAGRDKPFRLTRTTTGSARAMEALSFDRDVYAPIKTRDRSPAFEPVPVYTQPDVLLLDLPLLDGRYGETPDTPLVLLAASASPWPGSVTAYASPDEAGFEARASVEAPAIMATLETPLAIGPVHVRDLHNTVDVRVSGEQLENVSTRQSFNGANLAAVGTPETGWEIIHFASAELIAPATYRLSGLIRGRFATPARAHPPGSRLVMLDDALAPLSLSADEIDRPLIWKIGPTRFAIDHEAYGTQAFAPSGLSLKPFPPVHLTLVEQADGGADVRWIRQNRWQGGVWSTGDVPLTEVPEAYRIEIATSGGTLLRSVDVTQPNWTYPAAARAADNAAGAATLSVSQIAAINGPGTPCILTL